MDSNIMGSFLIFLKSVVVVLLSICLFVTVIFTWKGISPTTQLNIAMTWSPTIDDKLPLCSGNLLDQRQFRYETEGSYGNNLMTRSSGDGSCQLVDYTAKRIVACLDSLHHRQPSNIKLHFLFMGDSRMRQQFLNFVRVIPDYDTRLEPSHAPVRFQEDVEVTSEILGLRQTFKWQTFVSDDIKKLALQWTTSVPSQRPSLIFLSMALWHMIDGKHHDHYRYQKKLSELAPVLAQLANVTRVIWLNQYPTSEFYMDDLFGQTQIHSEKINNYNKIVRRILMENHNETKVQIWDSGNPLVEEYVRSCEIFIRYEIMKTGPNLLALKFYSSPYRNCIDFVHTGYSALSQVTQILYNDICGATQIQ